MAFPRNLLTDKEELVVEMHPHWIALVGPIVVTVLVAILWILVLPRVPFSGGGVHSALVWAIWIAGIVGLAGIAVWHPNPILFLFLIIGGLEAWKRLRAWRTGDPETAEYYAVTRTQRIAVAVTYLGLAALLVVGMAHSHVRV
jgi:hypothetical protein